MLIRKIFKKFYRSDSDITKHDMKKMLKENKKIILLDVRSIQEFNEGHLPNAINIPEYEISQKVEKILKDKNAVIIAYCSSGIRSKKAVKKMKKLGYTNIYNLDEEL